MYLDVPQCTAVPGRRSVAYCVTRPDVSGNAFAGLGQILRAVRKVRYAASNLGKLLQYPRGRGPGRPW